MRTRFVPILASTLTCVLLAAPATAQLGLPVGRTVGSVLDTAGRTLGPLPQSVGDTTRSAIRLANQRLDRLAAFVRRHSDVVELDGDGNPARRGELLLIEPDVEELARAEAAGFTVADREQLNTLNIIVVRLGLPPGQSLAKAEKALRKLLPGAVISADTLHFQSGAVLSSKSRRPGSAPAGINGSVGMIDGAPGPRTPVVATRGFAKGAPIPSNHGSAVASLLRVAGVRRIIVADVYGTDPAGGSALALARGLDWLTGEGMRVISISLVGPNNPLVGRAIAAAQRQGVYIVAAVGNDGPAAPPSYPASYTGVIAVTAVDGRRRALIEAGRALHLDYAGPGADLLAANAKGEWTTVRGTSYATPFVAARVAAALDQDVVTILDGEAIDLGRKGADAVFGRGLLCHFCPRRKMKD